ncbi:MAG: hydrogenase maturation nickel metallochaperone HypA [Candidatus Omnitrophica bacterium]|nr:hydrogenase maturation nickel metallochaperone HypA [Candidatus Omnitrophota bacterium]
MHETMFINEIFTILIQELGKDVFPGPVTVNVRLSPFSHVSAETLQESFRELAKGKNFQGVLLNVLPLELRLYCRSCKHDTRIAKKIFGCPMCGSADIDIQMDKEFLVESIEVEPNVKEAASGDEYK